MLKVATFCQTSPDWNRTPPIFSCCLGQDAAVCLQPTPSVRWAGRSSSVPPLRGALSGVRAPAHLGGSVPGHFSLAANTATLRGAHHAASPRISRSSICGRDDAETSDHLGQPPSAHRQPGRGRRPFVRPSQHRRRRVPAPWRDATRSSRLRGGRGGLSSRRDPPCHSALRPLTSDDLSASWK